MPAEELMGRLEGKRYISSTGCWEWLGTKNPKGYGMISVDGYMHSVHRIMASLCLNFDINDRTQHVLHTCDNPSCFNPEHLKIGTNNDNVQDRFDRHKWGAIAKLTPEQIEQIKIEVLRGRKQWEVALQFGVSSSTVSRIVNRKRWSRLPSIVKEGE